jgi:Protein of unknown function (DUF1153)
MENSSTSLRDGPVPPGGSDPFAAPRHDEGNPVRAHPLHDALAELPPPDTTRWVMRRKAQVVNGVRTGLLSVEEACRRYRLSEEEFNSWRAMIEQHGVAGLRVTRLQHYRKKP